MAWDRFRRWVAWGEVELFRGLSKLTFVLVVIVGLLIAGAVAGHVITAIVVSLILWWITKPVDGERFADLPEYLWSGEAGEDAFAWAVSVKDSVVGIVQRVIP